MTDVSTICAVVILPYFGAVCLPALKMTTAQVVETSVTVSNSPIQDYVHPDDQTQPTFEMTPGFKPFTRIIKQTRPAIGTYRSFQFRPEVVTLALKISRIRNSLMEKKNDY